MILSAFTSVTRRQGKTARLLPDDNSLAGLKPCLGQPPTRDAVLSGNKGCPPFITELKST